MSIRSDGNPTRGPPRPPEGPALTAKYQTHTRVYVRVHVHVHVHGGTLSRWRRRWCRVAVGKKNQTKVWCWKTQARLFIPAVFVVYLLKSYLHWHRDEGSYDVPVDILFKRHRCCGNRGDQTLSQGYGSVKTLLSVTWQLNVSAVCKEKTTGDAVVASEGSVFGDVWVQVEQRISGCVLLGSQTVEEDNVRQTH